MCPCGKKPDKPKGDEKPKAPATECKSCTITSKTVAKSPANRARTKIGVGEEVTLTTDKGPATWTATDGTITPKTGKHSSVTFSAPSKAASVTVTAKGSCTCSIKFDVVEPDNWTMIRSPGTKLRHKKGRPDCGWKGHMYFEPTDVNFYKVENREVDSAYVAPNPAKNCYKDYAGDMHGNYPKQPDGKVASGWFPLTSHDARGTTDKVDDSIYTGDPGEAKTGKKPPFNPGNGYFPITLQWRVNASAPKDMAVKKQEDEIKTTGKTISTKAGHTESTMWNDATSSW